MKRYLNEPLIHFLVLGALFFGGYRMLNHGSETQPGRIFVSRGEIAAMQEAFTRTWQRPPTRQELEGLVRDRVREEVYCREAIALGMDKDDTIIRRRLRQKMEFISDDMAAQNQPSDIELNAYLQAHTGKFHIEQQFTFRQVYLNPGKHGENLARDTADVLAQLNQAGADPSALGDSFLLEQEYAAVPTSELAKLFGEKFAAKLVEIAPGRWQGPVESGYGVHLVFVAHRTEGGRPALADVRDAVRREWDNAARLEANEKLYQELLKRYTVTIENPMLEAEELAAVK